MVRRRQTSSARVAMLGSGLLALTMSAHALPAQARVHERASAPPAAVSVVMSQPMVGELLDGVIRGVRTHWADTPWVAASTVVQVDDPAAAVANVTATWTLPTGEQWQSLSLSRQPGTKDWLFNPSAYSYAAIADQLGDWTITAVATDAADQVVATSQVTVTGRDPKSAVKPRLVLLKTVGRTVIKRRHTWRDYDGWWTEIKATVRFYDPDQVVGYAFIGDKAKRRPASSNWYGAKTVRSGDYIQFTDSIPVRDVVGKHKLFVSRDYFMPSDYRWSSTWSVGVPASTVWKLRHWKNFKHKRR